MARNRRRKAITELMEQNMREIKCIKNVMMMVIKMRIGCI